MLENRGAGFLLVVQWQNVVAIIAGVIVDCCVGALPGLIAGMGIAPLLFIHPFFISEPVGGQPYPQTIDVDTDDRGVMYVVDRQAGFGVLEYLG